MGSLSKTEAVFHGGGSASLKTMTDGSPKAQRYQAAKARSQRVEDNAFHLTQLGIGFCLATP